ncbi:MAG: hypothetical protein AAF677_09190 [Pseudomonadota bacterium]
MALEAFYAPTDWLALAVQGRVVRNSLAFLTPDSSGGGGGTGGGGTGGGGGGRGGGGGASLGNRPFEVGSADLADLRLAATLRLFEGQGQARCPMPDRRQSGPPTPGSTLGLPQAPEGGGGSGNRGFALAGTLGAAAWRSDAGIGLALTLPTADAAARDAAPTPDGPQQALLPRSGQPGRGVFTLEPGIWWRESAATPYGQVDWGINGVAAIDVGNNDAGFANQRRYGGLGFLALALERHWRVFGAVRGGVRHRDPDAIEAGPLVAVSTRAPDVSAVDAILGGELTLRGIGAGDGPSGVSGTRKLALWVSTPLLAPDSDPRLGLTTVNGRLDLWRGDAGGRDVTLGLAASAAVADRAAFDVWSIGLAARVSFAPEPPAAHPRPR